MIAAGEMRTGGQRQLQGGLGRDRLTVGEPPYAVGSEEFAPHA